MDFKKITLLLLFCALFGFMWVLSPHDVELYHYLSELDVHWVEDLMGRTLFEGDLPGASDPAIIFLIISLVLYGAANRTDADTSLKSKRPFLGFIVSASVIGGVLMVHVLKWFVGRARPKQVLIKGIYDFSEWFEVGPKYITNGVYRGSFPSGHTAIVVTFLTLAYAFSSGRKATPASVLKSSALCIAVLVYGVLMTVGRTMDRMHWMSDCVFSIFAVWIVIHVMYYWVLRVPQRMEAARSGRYEPCNWWEARFTLWMALFSTAILAVGLGLRAFVEQNVPWLALLVPVGAYVSYFSLKRALLLRSGSLAQLAQYVSASPASCEEDSGT